MKYDYAYIESLFEKFEKVVEFVENKKHYKASCKMYLGNGDTIDYQVNQKAIPHLIGVNTEYLKNSGYVNGSNAYDIFKNFVEKGAYNLYNNICSIIPTKIKAEKIFSEHIDKKLDIFYANIKIDLKEVDVVCKYCDIRDYVNGSTYGEVYDYILLKSYKNKNNEDRVTALCIVHDNVTDEYIPMSSRQYESISEAVEDLQKQFKNQEITLLTKIKTGKNFLGESYTIYIDNKVKAKKMNNLSLIKKACNCSIDLSYDYNSLLQSSKKFKSYNDMNNDTIDKIIDTMSEGKIIKLDSNSNQLSAIIDCWNNFITNGLRSPDNEDDYSTTIENLKNAKKLIEELQKENENLKENLEDCEEENFALKNENSTLLDQKNKVLEILKPNN